MTQGAAIFAVIASLCAVTDWIGVGRQLSTQEQIAKPAVMVSLAAAVVSLGDQPARWVVVAALLCSLIGDVFLLERFDNFFAGLASFFVAHVLYVVAFAGTLDHVDVRLLLAGMGVSLLLLALAGARIVSAARSSDRRLGVAVALYVGVLSVMVAAGWATGSTAATVGATVFALSDAVLGWNRFVQPLAHGRLATHLLYHIGQGWLAVWAIGL